MKIVIEIEAELDTEVGEETFPDIEKEIRERVSWAVGDGLLDVTMEPVKSWSSKVRKKLTLKS